LKKTHSDYPGLDESDHNGNYESFNGHDEDEFGEYEEQENGEGEFSDGLALDQNVSHGSDGVDLEASLPLHEYDREAGEVCNKTVGLTELFLNKRNES